MMAIRLFTPAGFMPSFEHGAVMIVACPDYEPSTAPMAHHHHDSSKKLHQPCPYASAAGAMALPGNLALLAAFLVFGGMLLIGRPLPFLERRRAHERPPLRGPPLPA